LTVIHALKYVSQPVVLKVVGYETTGAPGYLMELRQTADNLGISDRLEIIGTIPRREDLMRVCATCDVGLSLLPIRHQDANLEYMTGASNKPFDYLACGLPILVSRLPAWQEMFVEPGYALACDPADPASIAAAIQYFCDHPEQVQAMGERGRRRILTEWNYEAQFQDIVERLLEKPEMRISNPAEQSI
jgi:glycosyltransferase involved in cell wall biosynthesis